METSFSQTFQTVIIWWKLRNQIQFYTQSKPPAAIASRWCRGAGEDLNYRARSLWRGEESENWWRWTFVRTLIFNTTFGVRKIRMILFNFINSYGLMVYMSSFACKGYFGQNKELSLGRRKSLKWIQVMILNSNCWFCHWSRGSCPEIPYRDRQIVWKSDRLSLTYKKY